MVHASKLRVRRTVGEAVVSHRAGCRGARRRSVLSALRDHERKVITRAALVREVTSWCSKRLPGASRTEISKQMEAEVRQSCGNGLTGLHQNRGKEVENKDGAGRGATNAETNGIHAVCSEVGWVWQQNRKIELKTDSLSGSSRV